MGSRLEKNSKDVRKRIENHNFDDEEGEEYQGSKFGGFGDYMRRKKIKLQNLDAELRSQSADKPQIFRNVVIHVNGYTQPSLSDLHTLIVSHGGGFLQYLDGKTTVTHVVASHLTPKKKVEFSRYRIVKPAWVVDSVHAGQLLPWENYRVVDEGVTQKVLGFSQGQMVSQASTQKLGYRDQTETSWYTSHVKGLANKIDGTAEVEESIDEHDKEKPSHGEDTVMASAQVDARPEFDTELTTDDVRDEDGRLTGLVKAAPVTFADDRNDAPVISNGENTDELKRALAEAVTGDPNPTHAAKAEKRQLTAEEHNAILLSNPHMAKSSTANPDFLNQYYRESRLHHLSAWKAELKAQMQARAQESSSQKQKSKKAPGSRSYVMHVDFDSFFAAVSLRKNPQLKDLPVVVAHGSGPGSEIASCNYPARKYGVKNGMWMKYALNLCPTLKVLPYDYKAYEEASKHFYDSILAVDGIAQSISIDEALIDVSVQCIQAGGSDGKALSEGSIYREQAKADEIAEKLRASIREKTGCEVSIGIGSNILLAKTALRKAKPAGQYQVKPEEVLDFLADLTVTDLPGVAYSIGKKLEEVGVKYVKDIRALNKEKLITTLGPKTGEKIWDYSRGIDRQEVGEQVVRKSVSAEINWGIRFITQQQAEDFVLSLCEELSKRLLEQTVKGRQLTMKIMRKAADAGLDPPKNLGHGKCDTFNKSIVLGVATYDKNILGKEAVSILRSYGFPPGELRGLGVQMQKLEPIKPSANFASTTVESSQRRLQFKRPDVSSMPNKSLQATAFSAKPNEKPESTAALQIDNSAQASLKDQIEEQLTPEKKTQLSVLGAIKNQQQCDGPLNISGTQFMIPTQIDPDVLAELPAEIRSKIASKQGKLESGLNGLNTSRLEDKSRSASPYPSEPENILPNQSQLDPEALAALPEDVREEIMAHYRENQAGTAARQFARALPHSPRKAKSTSGKKPNVTPTKKQKTTAVLNRAKSKATNASGPTLTQSNFVSMAKISDAAAQGNVVADEDISQSFLEELPADIRAEILAEQRRNRMKQKSGLNVTSMKRRTKPEASETGPGQQKLKLPAAPAKPTFTSRKLTELPDLRKQMSAWVQAFSGEGEDGPYPEDIEALGTFLKRVVLEESDMSKAAAVIDWLAYVVDDWPFGTTVIRQAWIDAILTLKCFVQAAVKERGLPPVRFAVY